MDIHPTKGGQPWILSQGKHPLCQPDWSSERTGLRVEEEMPTLTRFPLTKSQLPSCATNGSLKSLEHLTLPLYCRRILATSDLESCFSAHVSEAYILQGLTFPILKALSRFYPEVQKVSSLYNSCFMTDLVLYQNEVTKNSALANWISKGHPCCIKGVAQYKCDYIMLVL